MVNEEGGYCRSEDELAKEGGRRGRGGKGVSQWDDLGSYAPVVWNACTGIEMNREEMINYDTVSKRKE